MSKFLDSSVFLHAYLSPKRKLTSREIEIKTCAKEIVRRLDDGTENFITSVVHVSEIVNIVEARLGLNTSLRVLETLLSLDNLDIVSVSASDYQKALVVAERYGISPNDAVAAIIAEKMSLKDIYSFDKHFDSIPWIRRRTCD